MSSSKVQKKILKKKPQKSLARAKQKPSNPSLQITPAEIASLKDQIFAARMLSEKCDLAESARVYQQVLEQAKEKSFVPAIIEALIGLLRLAAEALDESAISRWDREIDRVFSLDPSQVPATVWYCKGLVEQRLHSLTRAQRYYHRFLRMSRSSVKISGAFEILTREDCEARAWAALAAVFRERGRLKRAEFIAQSALAHYGPKNLKNINSTFYHLLGYISELRRDFDGALKWYREAHKSMLQDHNWYFYLYILYSYARVARLQQQYASAYQNLEMLELGAAGPEFGYLHAEILAERKRLEQDAVDLLIDSRKGVIRTRESGTVSLRKQYVLLSILDELSVAHQSHNREDGAGLSKAEIIRRVWGESYRPEAHDNKLYYNINRLRKLIEPDMKNPQYLLNWREGYRLAPGLKVQRIGIVETQKQGGET